VSLEVLEAEAYLESARGRLTYRTTKHTRELLVADKANLVREVLLIYTRRAKYCSPIQYTLKVH
jgi:hypothetical protein